MCHSMRPSMLVSGALCLPHNKYFLFSSSLFEALGNVTRVQLVSVINVKQKNNKKGVDSVQSFSSLMTSCPQAMCGLCARKDLSL